MAPRKKLARAYHSDSSEDEQEQTAKRVQEDRYDVEDDEDILGDEATDEEAEVSADDDDAGSEDEPRAPMAGFSSAVSNLLAQSMPKDAAPILAKERSREHELEREKREYKEAKAAAHERRALRLKEHLDISAYGVPHERLLRRVATRGVVRLFNAINQQQRIVESAVSTKKTSSEKEKVAKLSQQGFLDLLKSGGNKSVAVGSE